MNNTIITTINNTNQISLEAAKIEALICCAKLNKLSYEAYVGCNKITEQIHKAIEDKQNK